MNKDNLAIFGAITVCLCAVVFLKMRKVDNKDDKELIRGF